MKTVTQMSIGQRGQAVIPKALRERYGPQPNTEAEFVDERGQLLVRPAVTSEPGRKDIWDPAWGVLRRKIRHVDDACEEMRGR